MKKFKDYIICFFNRRIGLSELEKELVSHGMDILICDGRNFVSVILLSFFLGTTRRTILYLVILSCLRGHTGGWHSKTELGCFVTYNISYLLLIWLSYRSIHPYIMNLIISTSASYIIWFSPIEHINNPLSNQEREKNKMISVYYSMVFFFLYTVLLIHKQTGYAAIISLAFVYDAILMELLRRSGKRRTYGH